MKSSKWKLYAIVECPICEGAECIYGTDDSDKQQHTSLVTGETFTLSGNTKVARMHREVDWTKILMRD